MLVDRITRRAHHPSHPSSASPLERITPRAPRPSRFRRATCRSSSRLSRRRPPTSAQRLKSDIKRLLFPKKSLMPLEHDQHQARDLHHRRGRHGAEVVHEIVPDEERFHEVVVVGHRQLGPSSASPLKRWTHAGDQDDMLVAASLNTPFRSGRAAQFILTFEALISLAIGRRPTTSTRGGPFLDGGAAPRGGLL